jgi:6-phosphogluconate dehydrogenase
MQIGMIGLGKMGANLVRRLQARGHRCVVFDLDPERIQALTAVGAEPAMSIAELVGRLEPPRVVWVMVPAGAATEETVLELAAHMEPGAIVIDGGNTYYKDDIGRAHTLQKHGVHYIDVGTSGGVWGAELGYCLMIGGPREAVQYLDPLFASLAPGGIIKTPGDGGRGAHSAALGYLYCGPAGAGHFVKMIHNGIEYGLMQAYAEGFEILRNAQSPALLAEHRYELDLAAIAELWRHGSVIRSWLLDLSAMALAEDPELKAYTGFVQDSGEGRWALDAAMEEAVPVPVLAASLFTRFRSRQEQPFAERLLSAMRRQFGGHTERSGRG